MNINEIIEMWDVDCHIDKTELADASLIIPKLHSKYYRIFITERMIAKKLEGDRKELLRIKHEYYMGILPEEELQERGYAPFALKILKADLSMYIEADSEIRKLDDKLAVQREKIDFVESIIKSLTNRGYNIRTAMDFIKFQHGS